MNLFFKRLFKLIAGLFLFALGNVTIMRSSLGYPPWDVLHAGLADTVGLTIGTLVIIVSLVLVVIVQLSGEKLGLGTLCNMVLMGIYMDLIIFLDFLPRPASLPARAALMLLGMLIVATGSYHYISSGFGAGPRDSLMVVLRRKTGLPVGLCRSVLECVVVLAGWLLGGPVGLGTFIVAVGIGAFIQMVFAIARFDAAAIQHETLTVTWQNLRRSRS